MDQCVDCGRKAQGLLNEHGAGVLVCFRCLDVRMPGSRISHLIRSFHREPTGRETCPHCGWTAARYAETELMGCPLCYQAIQTKSPIG